MEATHVVLWSRPEAFAQPVLSVWLTGQALFCSGQKVSRDSQTRLTFLESFEHIDITNPGESTLDVRVPGLGSEALNRSFQAFFPESRELPLTPSFTLKKKL